MALPFPIAATQTDAKSPIDQQLMDALRLNQEYLESQLGGASAGGIINFKVNGFLTRIKALLNQGAGKHLDGGIIANAVTFTNAKLYLEKTGDSGALEVDVLRHKEVQHPINSITAQYKANVQSVGRLGVALSTQAITKATPDILTQEITKPKTARDISSIVSIGDDQWLITFTGSLLDGDYIVGDSINISGASAGANNGNFEIKKVNFDGLPSVVVSNPSGVEQLGVGGTGQLNLFQYTFNALVDDDFVVGETAYFTGHSNSSNDGTFEIFKVNNGGNNIWVKSPNGVTQNGVAGTVKVNRFRYVYASSVDDTQYVVGENAEFSGHSSSINNGKFRIVAVNDVGNSITVFNETTSHNEQGGAAGNAQTLRWLLSMPTDPSTDDDVQVNDFIRLSSMTSSNNDGDYQVKFVKRFGVNNIEIYNANGIVQGGVAGNLETSKKLVNFTQDFSALYIVGESRVALEGIHNLEDTDKREYEVKEINRGGFSNYNVVIEAIGVGEYQGSQGRVAREVRSIFITRPRLEINSSISSRYLQKNTTATFKNGGVEADTILSMDVLEVPNGLPSNLVLSLS